MAVVRKRQDDTNLKILRELVTSGGGNRQCFDCGQKGPTYVNMTIGSFVCTRCSGVLRGLTPPHRVKSISMATFSPEEIEFLKSHGNDVCAKTWLGLWDPKRIIHQDQRELMIDKYERKRYYLEPASPLKSLTNATKVSGLSSSNNSINTNGSGNNHLNGNISNSSNSSNNSINNGFSNGGNNNNKNLSNNSSKNSIDGGFNKGGIGIIALTPPTSLRLTKSNDIVNNSSNNSTNNNNNNNNRHQKRYNFTTNDDNSNIKNSPLMNGGGGGGISGISNNNKSSLNIAVNNSQSFTPDSDFVADFSTANIFNATSTTIGGTTQNNSNNINNNNVPNGFKVHQIGGGGNIPNGFQQTKNYINGSSGGGGGPTTNHVGGFTATNAVNENFADFDHAPIYNAAAYQNVSINNNSITTHNNSNNNNSNNFKNNANSYCNYFTTDVSNSANNIAVQPPCYSSSNYCSNSINNCNNNVNYNGTSIISNHNNSTSMTSNGISASLNNLQWNVWQQFQWPSFTISSTNIEPNQNRWSLPMANSLSNHANIILNNSNSTPPADRYAALKDLDEQLRESKQAAATAVAVDTFSSNVQAQSSIVNPFKTNPPSQTTQQQQQSINPFQTSTFNGNQTNSIFGTPQQAQNSQNNATTTTTAAVATGVANTAFNMHPIPTNFNGYTTTNQGGVTILTNGTNGCNSFGFGAGAQTITAGNSMTNIKNPFAINSNNPFL